MKEKIKKFLPKIEKKNSLILKSVTKETLFHQDIVFLVWNVYKKNNDVKWREEFEYIMNVYHPDIILFQESVSTFTIEPIHSYRHFGYLFFPNFSYKNRAYGLLNASKSKIINFNSLYSRDFEPILKTPKMIMATKYKLNNGETLLVVNVHLINFVKTEKFQAQLRQIEEVCLSHKGAVVLAGDFNTWNRKRFSLLCESAKKLSLKMVKFPVNSSKRSILKEPLDHIFYRGLKLKRSKVLEFCKSSDHKPLLASFKVEK